MITSFRGKNTKDTEDSSETIISSSSYIYNFLNEQKVNQKLSVTTQQLDADNFDNIMEKQK